ncbi:MAG: ThiF family adenylyltransferase [Candidatus Micrarchaeota archaeon]|nr:ThiF family adenylyltransferase [Candidatus Micrarchaeota archaeon]
MASNRLTHANLSTLGKKGQARLSNSTFGIAGLGGVGGIAFELLLRAGAGEIRISDHGFFEESNANRQILWSSRADGKLKIQSALSRAISLSKNCRIIPFGKITACNSEEFSRGCTAVIDATDSPDSRKTVFSGCSPSKTPYIFASALGARGMLSVISGAHLQKNHPFLKKNSRAQKCDHALGPVANTIGCLASQQAINLALSKQVIMFPSILSLDAFSKNPIAIHSF